MKFLILKLGTGLLGPGQSYEVRLQDTQSGLQREYLGVYPKPDIISESLSTDLLTHLLTCLRVDKLVYESSTL